MVFYTSSNRLGEGMIGLIKHLKKCRSFMSCFVLIYFNLKRYVFLCAARFRLAAFIVGEMGLELNGAVCAGKGWTGLAHLSLFFACKLTPLSVWLSTKFAFNTCLSLLFLTHGALIERLRVTRGFLCSGF